MIDTTELRAACAALWESFTPMEKRVLRFARKPITEGRLRNRVTPKQEGELRIALALLESCGHLERINSQHPLNGTSVAVYHNPIGAEIEDQLPRATWISGMRDHDRLHFHVGQPCDPLLDCICAAVEYAQSLNIPYSYKLQNDRLTIARVAQ